MARKKSKTLTDAEHRIMEVIWKKGSATVGEVAEQYGAERGLARSTVLTMMERLRAKAYLKRKQVDGGVYRYSSTARQDDVVRNAVGSFSDSE